MIIWIVVGVIVLIAVVGIIIYAMRSGGGEGDIQVRLEEFAGRTTPMSLEEIELSQPFSERVIRPTLQILADKFKSLSPENARASVELKLEQAGRPYNWGAAEFLGLRVGAALVIGVLLFLAVSLSQSFLYGILSAVVGALMGYMLPVLWLGSKIGRRQKEIIKTLPDALDLLTITVEAGMGFDGAMQKVAEKWDNELGKGFNKVVQEMRLGIPRRDALRNMDDSMGVPDVKTLVAAIIQAEQLGVSIAKILRVQSQQMREKRRQRAEAEANKAPIKMLFPMVFLIFPSLFIVLLGPAALIILETPGLIN